MTCNGKYYRLNNEFKYQTVYCISDRYCISNRYSISDRYSIDYGVKNDTSEADKRQCSRVAIYCRG